MSAQSAAEIRHEAFKLLHDADWSDRGIARAFGLSQQTIRHWRIKSGLPANGANFGAAKIDEERALGLYQSSHNDYEIASALGVDRTSVCKWRKSRGLPAIPQERLMSREKIREVRKMLSLGATKDQVAAEFSIDRRTVQKLRQDVTGPSLRRTGLNNRCVRRQVRRDPSIMRRIERAIGNGLPPEVRYEAALSLYTEVLEGRVLPEAIEKRAASVRSQAWSLCGSKYGPRSLDEEIGEEGDWTLMDSLEDESALEAMEAAAAAAWNDNDLADC